MMVFYIITIFCVLAVSKASEQYQDPATDPRNIYRPCPDFNLDCIRFYFSSHSDCQLALGPVRDPLFLPHYKLDFPTTNITIDLYDVNIGNMDGDIVEFYINIETRKLVLALEVHNLTLSSPKTTINFNRKKKEPIMRTDFVDFNYGTVILTITFQSLMNLKMDKADVFSYVEEIHPNFKMGPNFSSSLDPVTKRQFEKLMNNFPNELREVFSLQGTVFMENYIQDNICDFGLDLSTDRTIRKNKKHSE